jgi:hypothetical protein
MLTYYGLRQLVKKGAEHEVEIMGYRPLFGSFLFFLDYVARLGCRPMVLPMLRPILQCINRCLGNVRGSIYVMLGLYSYVNVC